MASTFQQQSHTPPVDTSPVVDTYKPSIIPPEALVVRSNNLPAFRIICFIIMVHLIGSNITGVFTTLAFKTSILNIQFTPFFIALCVLGCFSPCAKYKNIFISLFLAGMLRFLVCVIIHLVTSDSFVNALNPIIGDIMQVAYMGPIIYEVIFKKLERNNSTPLVENTGYSLSSEDYNHLEKYFAYLLLVTFASSLFFFFYILLLGVVSTILIYGALGAIAAIICFLVPNHILILVLIAADILVNIIYCIASYVNFLGIYHFSTLYLFSTVVLVGSMVIVNGTMIKILNNKRTRSFVSV
eukprot:TRINITY_DN5001_c0_g1_i1.p1 TRINITY_DN5001_c0_g1~~TRINITY_DN5001_c0_g1_i1.p1  ORF type:complete len:308 (-),score=22.73 TRINITY_DN5001_c0_g1_i1:102-995(-)